MAGTGRFEIDLPDGWFRIDLDPSTGRRSAAALVDGWVSRQPELADNRQPLIDMITTTAQHARESRCVFAAAAFGAQAGVGPSYAGLVVRVLPWPSPALEPAEFCDRMAAAARSDGAVTSAEPVQVAGRPMVLVRQESTVAEAGGSPSAVTSFVVPMKASGVFANLEFASPVSPAPEHTFAHVAATARVSG